MVPALIEPENPAVGGEVGFATGKVIEGPFSDFDDVIFDERRALACALLGMLETAFPFQHGPAVEPVLRQLAEDTAEVDLPVAERAEPSGPIDPALVAAVDT